MFQESWRNRGIGADWWEEVVQTWGRGGTCAGLDGAGLGNGWHGRVTFFRVRGSEWVGFGRGGAAGVCIGTSGGNLAKQNGERKEMAVVQSWARGQAVREGDGFGRT